jgi:endonuclease-3 related protein
MNPSIDLRELYDLLFDHYGSQGWWPLLSWQGTNPTLRGRCTGYHENRYDIPSTDVERLEIAIGAILTQNTSWINAEKALVELNSKGLLSIDGILSTSLEDLGPIIRSSGYYNQKAKKLYALMSFFKKHSIAECVSAPLDQIHSQILEINGVGKETADSILLYAFSRLIFVIDTYTYRLLVHLGYISPTARKDNSYDQIQNQFQQSIPPSISIYNEYHALIVQHTVRICTKIPKCENCFLKDRCSKIPLAESLEKPKKKIKK